MEENTHCQSAMEMPLANTLTYSHSFDNSPSQLLICMGEGGGEKEKKTGGWVLCSFYLLEHYVIWKSETESKKPLSRLYVVLILNAFL